MCSYMKAHRTSLMSSSLLHRQPQVYFIHIAWMVCKIEGRWPDSFCIVWCRFQNMQHPWIVPTELFCPGGTSLKFRRRRRIKIVIHVEVTALTCRINKNNNTYRLSGPSLHPAGRQKVERAVTQYWTRNTWNMTEASRYICTLICPLTGPATNHCTGNGLGNLQIVERPNVHIISLQLVIHYAYEHWLIASEFWIPTINIFLFFICVTRYPTGRREIRLIRSSRWINSI